MIDPVQTLKQQLGELIWQNHILAAELEKTKKELEDLKDEHQRNA